MVLSKDYIGTVIYNEDPTFAGRCKVKVFGLFDDLPDENIPWFVPSTSTIYSTEGGGNISIPKLNSIVRVKFTNDDLYSGEYSNLQCIDPSLIDEIKDDYIGTHVLLYDADEELLIIYQKMSGLRLFHKGACITLDPTGSIQARHQNNKNVVEINENDITITTASGGSGSDSTGIINITSGNTININSAGTVNVNSKNVNIGNNANKHAVIAEELQLVLQEIVAQLALKSPQGCPGLQGNTFNNIRSNSILISK